MNLNNIIPGFSEYDLLEFMCFVWKVEWEGYSYAAKHYGPRFESETLNELVSTRSGLRKLYNTYKPLAEEWQDTIEDKVLMDLNHNHLDERQKREQDAALYAIKLQNGNLIYCKTKEYFEAIKSDKYYKDCELLARTEPAGKWWKYEDKE